METVGDRLNKLLETMNMKKIDFAKELDRSTGNISDWLSNKCNPGKRALKTMTEKFGVSDKWILEGVGDMFITPTNSEDNNSTNSEIQKNANFIGELSPEEMRIIELFRQLDNIEKIKIEGILENKVSESRDIKRGILSNYQNGEEVATLENRGTA